MSHRAFLQLQQKRNVPFYAFYLTGSYRDDDAVVLVQRSPDGVSRIAISLLDDELRQRAHCDQKRWQVSVQASEDDCGFLLRLPKGAIVQLAWSDERVADRNCEDNHGPHDNHGPRDDRESRHDDRRDGGRQNAHHDGERRGERHDDHGFVTFSVPNGAFREFDDWVRKPER